MASGIRHTKTSTVPVLRVCKKRRCRVRVPLTVRFRFEGRSDEMFPAGRTDSIAVEVFQSRR